MSKTASKGGSGIQSIFAALVIPIAIGIGVLIWKFVMGDPAGFEGGDTEKNPLPGHILAAMYKGGLLVPVLIGMFITVVTFAIERYITINKSKGTGSIDSFIMKIRTMMASGDLNGAKAECAKQRGSIANVVNAGITAYEQMTNDKELDKERKIVAIQKELEEEKSRSKLLSLENEKNDELKNKIREQLKHVFGVIINIIILSEI